MMNRKTLLTGAVIVAICLAAAIFWWRSERGALPPYLARANGRIEMTRIDVAVKYAGRVIDLLFREGDAVQHGAILARQDEAETKAQIAGAEAQRQRAISAIGKAEADVAVRRKNQGLAQLEWDQALMMRGKSLVSQVELDRRRLALEAETAGVAAAMEAAKEARDALGEADAQLARLKVILGEETIHAPVNGRIEYKIIEKDAVLPAGGRIALLLETDDVYMTVFLPDKVVGKTKMGDEARILLDAFKEPLPAYISFVSPEAEFTPKYVETQAERDKLLYRVKLQIPIDAARRHAGILKSGMTGNGYVRTDTSSPWPAFLLVAQEGAKAK
jgi:HlyD family secretion protein